MLAQVPEGITPVGYITHGQTHRLVRVSPEETRYANATTVGRAAASPVAHSPSPAVLRLPGPAPCGALSPRAAQTTTSDLPDQRRSSRGPRATHTAGLMADNIAHGRSEAWRHLRSPTTNAWRSEAEGPPIWALHSRRLAEGARRSACASHTRSQRCCAVERLLVREGPGRGLQCGACYTLPYALYHRMGAQRTGGLHGRTAQGLTCLRNRADCTVAPHGCSCAADRLDVYYIYGRQVQVYIYICNYIYI